MYEYYWLICSTHASKRGYGTPNFEKTPKNLKNSTYSPLAPSITPIRTQTCVSGFVALCPRYNTM